MALPSFVSPTRPPSFIPALKPKRVLRGGGAPVAEARHPHKRPIVPPLPLHIISATSGIRSSSATLKSSSSALRSNADDSSVLSSARNFLDSVAPIPELPSRPSVRITTWKAQLQRKKKLPSGLEWDSFASSPRLASSKVSTHRSYELSGGKRRVYKRMAPPMFANTEANQLMELLESETKAHLAIFKRPPSPSRLVPDKLPGYSLQRRVEGTWAYQPPDTRQEALNEWFIKRIKRPPPSTDKVHIAFGKITYPVVNPRRKKRPPEPPPPPIEVPKMTLTPRRSTVVAN